MRFFDPKDDLLICRRRLPHWQQDGTIAFITWRMADSMPKPILDQWRAKRNHWLNVRGIDPAAETWREKLEALGAAAVSEFHETFTQEWHEALDAGHGSCVLKNPVLAGIVSDSLLHFQGTRYDMMDFVIMPNHVHLLAVFQDGAGMLQMCESWKRYTGRLIHAQTGGSGRFWQQDSFDHLVRHEKQFYRLRRYIEDNPTKAGLKSGQYLWYHNNQEIHAGTHPRIEI